MKRNSSKRKSIFEFNHIDKSLSEEQYNTITNLYKHYHKKHWCYKKSYKSYKFLDNIFSISSLTLIAVGTITGGLTLNPFILGVINGAGLIVGGITKKKDFKKKIETSKLAYTTYEKVLVELRSALRGEEWNKEEFVDRIKILDEMIIDQCPSSADNFVVQYKKKFNIWIKY